jgi:hypothetical protein
MLWVDEERTVPLNEISGLWTGQTDDWDVEVNGHKAEIDGLPNYFIRLKHKTYLQMGIISPAGGALIGCSAEAESEIIEHFKNQLGADEKAAHINGETQ